VIYESRLELARLLYADSEFHVNRIVAQPFLLSAKVDVQAAVDIRQGTGCSPV
jgi:hypothetical protein